MGSTMCRLLGGCASSTARGQSWTRPIDERLDGNFDPNKMRWLLMVGLWCAHPKDKERPKAGQVMKVLNQLDTPLPLFP